MSSTIDSNCVLNLSTWTNVDEIEYTLFELLIIVILDSISDFADDANTKALFSSMNTYDWLIIANDWVASTINDNTVRIITNSLAEAVFYFIFIVFLPFLFRSEGK